LSLVPKLVESYRIAITASALICIAWATIRFEASMRAASQTCVNSSMLPPAIDFNPPTIPRPDARRPHDDAAHDT
jgi:hypothetical protein